MASCGEGCRQVENRRNDDPGVRRTEMNVHILPEDDKLPDLGRRTPTAFTWVFGVKVPF